MFIKSACFPALMDTALYELETLKFTPQIVAELNQVLLFPNQHYLALILVFKLCKSFSYQMKIAQH